jgi:hypothetical protein
MKYKDVSTNQHSRKNNLNSNKIPDNTNSNKISDETPGVTVGKNLSLIYIFLFSLQISLH